MTTKRAMLKTLPFLFLIPGFAIGCADASSEDGGGGDQATEDALTASADASFVGAIELNGTKLCTAALIDVGTGAEVAGLTASGRAVVMGQACVDALYAGNLAKDAAIIGAKFVQKGVEIPIVAVGAATEIGAGFVVGALDESKEQYKNTARNLKALKLFEGWGGNIDLQAQAKASSLVRIDGNGVAAAATASAATSAEINFGTSCTSWSTKAKAFGGAGAGASASAAVGNPLASGIAVAEVRGELRFMGTVDGGCILKKAERLGNTVTDLALAPLKIARAGLEGAGDEIRDMNAEAKFVGTFTVDASNVGDRGKARKVRVYLPAGKTIRLDSSANVQAYPVGGGAKLCEGQILGLGACEFRAQGTRFDFEVRADGLVTDTANIRIYVK